MLTSDAHRRVLRPGVGSLVGALFGALGCGESGERAAPSVAVGGAGAPCRAFDEVRFGAAVCDGELRCSGLPSTDPGTGPRCHSPCSTDSECELAAGEVCNFGLCVEAGSAEECSTALITPSARAGTPRADRNLEYLALALSDGIVADQATYERLERDLAVIRQLRPDLGGIGYRIPQGDQLGLAVTLEVLNDMEHGRYRHWDCLNRSLGMVEMLPSVSILSGFDSTPYVYLEFEGVYDLERVAQAYAELPEVAQAEAGGSLGDGSSICVVPTEGSWQYVLDEAGGDCPSGCTEHRYHHFEVTRGGAVVAGEPWVTGEGAEAPPQPAWVAPFLAAGYAVDASGHCGRPR